MFLFKTGKRVSVSAIALLAALLLAACGDNTATTGSVATTAAATTAGSATTAAMMSPTTAAMSGTTMAGTTGAMTAGTTMAMTGTTAAMTPGTTMAMTGTTAAGTAMTSTMDYSKLSGNITASGSTLVQPVMDAWVRSFAGLAAQAKINYSGVGSGTGRSDFTSNKTDFGVSDTQLPAADVAKYTGGVVQIPMTLAGVVLSYNLQGVTDLKLDPDTIGKIFTGKITKWDDAAIKALNSGATLPSLPITIAVRSDSSGTSSVFSNYVATISPDFKALNIAGSQPTWGSAGLSPVQGKGNDGVAGLIAQTPGTVGYVEVAYAISNKLAYAQIKNAAGNFVKPTVDSLTAAAAGATVPADTLNVNLLNQPGANAYPITTTTYAMLPMQFKDQTKAQTVVDFIYYCTHEGQQAVTALNYAPLPPNFVSAIEAKLKTITVGGSPVMK